MEESIKNAYRRGYEDGYDQGCMDMLDTDFGEEALKEELSGYSIKGSDDEILQITWDEYESDETGAES